MQLEQVDNMTLQQQVSDAFKERYGEAPAMLVWAPGRVNIIGGHTEYNGGYTLPININRYTVVALRAREDGVAKVYSTAFDEEVTFDLMQFEHQDDHWSEYVRAAAWALGDEGYALRGWEGVIGGDIPMGAGLGASASLLLAVLRAFAEVSGFPFDAREMAKLANKAEHDWVGEVGSLADVLSVALGKPGEAMLIDAQSMDVEPVEFPYNAKVVLLDNGTRADRAAVESIMKSRLDEIIAAVKAYKVSHLRDLSMSRFEKDADELEDNIFKRARHVLTENGRTILAAEMLRSNAVATVGRLMNDSHTSLRDDYGVHSEDIETIRRIVLEQPNVLGARGAGSGMGGTVVALVSDISADTVSKLVVSSYKRETDSDLNAFVVEPAGGVEVVMPDEQ